MKKAENIKTELRSILKRSNAVSSQLTGWLLLVLCSLMAVNASAGIATINQTIELKPGWNAVYVEIDPVVNDVETIFSGIPVASVWRWIPGQLGKDFISDPAEGLMNLEGWFGYFPEPKPEAFLSNIYTLSANTAYLI